MAAGLALAAAGALLLSGVPDQAGYLADLLPGFLALGLGIGMAFVAVSIAAMADVPHESAGLASGLMTTAHELGAALGVAVLGSIVATSGSLVDGYRDGFLAAAIAAGVVAAVTAVVVPSVRPAPGVAHSMHQLVRRQMPEAAMDHRRATAERNEVAILDATERLLARRQALSMAAIAAEAGVSRPTLYAHYKTLGAVVERVVGRAVEGSLGAVDAAEPASGPADQALERMLMASWNHLAGLGALAAGAAEHVPADHLHRTHAPLMTRLHTLVERGRSDGVFRTDLPADWLVSAFYSLVHAAEDHARARGLAREEMGEVLLTTVRDLFAAKR